MKTENAKAIAFWTSIILGQGVVAMVASYFIA